MEKTHIVKALEDIVGIEYVATDEATLTVYSRGILDPYRGKPDYVVMPKSVEEIQSILRLANRERIPVYPISSGLSGNATAPYGGIILDLMRMDKLEIDEENRQAILEPGVTLGRLAKELEKRKLVCPYPGAPPSVSYLSFSLSWSGGDRYPYVLPALLIRSLAVALPTGEILRTGTAALPGFKWVARHLTGDLTPLFIDTQGIFGVVTKISIQLFPKPEFSDMITYSSENIEDLLRPAKDICYQMIPEYTIATNALHELVMVRGTKYPAKKEKNLPEYLCTHIVSGSRKGVKLKMDAIRKIVSAHIEKIPGLRFYELDTEQRSARLELPNKALGNGVNYRGGGFLYLISHAHSNEVTDKKLHEHAEIMQRYGLESCFKAAIINNTARFGMMYELLYDQTNPKEVQNVRECYKELCKNFMKDGWLPSRVRPHYMMQAPITMQLFGTQYKLLKKIKRLVDPNGIMSPGRLAI